MAIDENLTYDEFAINISQFDKKDKWFRHLADNFLACCFDFILQLQGEVSLYLMMSLDEECVGEDRFTAGDEDYEGFWNCLVHTLNTRNYKTKIETLKSFCAACKVTSLMNL